MKRIYKKLASLVRDEEGTEVVEWALAGGLIVALGAAIFAALGGNVNTKMTALNTMVANAP